MADESKNSRVEDIQDNCISCGSTKYFFELDGVVFGRKKFMATDEA